MLLDAFTLSWRIAEIIVRCCVALIRRTGNNDAAVNVSLEGAHSLLCARGSPLAPVRTMELGT